MTTVFVLPGHVTPVDAIDHLRGHMQTGPLDCVYIPEGYYRELDLDQFVVEVGKFALEHTDDIGGEFYIFGDYQGSMLWGKFMLLTIAARAPTMTNPFFFEWGECKHSKPYGLLHCQSVGGE